MRDLQLGCPSSQLRSPFQGNTIWKDTSESPKLVESLQSHGARAGVEGLWARLGLWGTARDVPERPTRVCPSLLPNDRGVLGHLCGRPEVKVKTRRQLQTNHGEEAACY